MGIGAAMRPRELDFDGTGAAVPCGRGRGGYTQ